MEHLSLREKAYELIRDKLLNHEFEPGSRIREDVLAEEFEMSRTPVREAINQLSADGLVINIPRKGIFTLCFSPEDVMDLIKVRESLEVLAVCECIDRASDEQIGEIEKILEKFHEAQMNNNIVEQNRLDSYFHKKIATYSANRKLAEFIDDIEDFMRMARNTQNPKMMIENRERSYQQHFNILNSIRKRDKETAVSAVRENIKGMKEKLHL